MSSGCRGTQASGVARSRLSMSKTGWCCAQSGVPGTRRSSAGEPSCRGPARGRPRPVSAHGTQDSLAVVQRASDSSCATAPLAHTGPRSKVSQPPHWALRQTAASVAGRLARSASAFKPLALPLATPLALAETRAGMNRTLPLERTRSYYYLPERGLRVTTRYILQVRGRGLPKRHLFRFVPSCWRPCSRA